MHSDLDSDGCKALRKKKEEWMTTCWEMGWDGTKGEQCGGETGWIWIRDPQSSIADRLYRCSGPAGVLVCTN